MKKEQAYCIDTSAVIDLWRRLYPRDVFPSLWENIEKLIQEEVIIAPKEVLKELEKEEDELYKWAKKYKDMFMNLDEGQIDKVKDIQGKFPKLVDVSKTIPEADPFVIALALVNKITVISMEKSSNIRLNKNAKPKLPDVCIEYKVKCIQLLEFFREQNWNF